MRLVLSIISTVTFLAPTSTMETPFELTATPLPPSAIPSQETIIAAAHSILDSIPKWKQGKTYQKVVKASSRPKGPKDSAPWHCRTSEHKPDEVSFDTMWAKLGVDKPLNEKQFIPDISKVTKIKEISPTETIWSMYYKFPPPLSPRIFTVLQVTQLTEVSPRTGIIVSVPIDLSSDAELAKMEETGVKGRYAAVERLLELEDGSTQWVMATSSIAGGFIPPFLAESSMDGKIAEDVPHFLKWLQSQPKS
ncbi:hypothetical protein C8J56DRAFT_956180 [Mycena floridula]|nr:hypothetical protein C8J56DRAFT_956180 [Mycena floridula]